MRGPRPQTFFAAISFSILRMKRGEYCLCSGELHAGLHRLIACLMCRQFRGAQLDPHRVIEPSGLVHPVSAEQACGELPEFGGGHGAFSYFVLKGLEGAADENGDGAVTGEELIRYVTTQVPRATQEKQHPQDISPGTVDIKLSDIKKPGINLAHWRMLLDSRNGQPLYLASASPGNELGADQADDDIDHGDPRNRGSPRD